jgi:hypothetical protein
MDGIQDILYGLASLLIGIGIAGIPIALYKHKKNATELKKLEEQRRIKELEIEGQNNQLKILEEENRKWDRIIENKK